MSDIEVGEIVEVGSWSVALFLGWRAPRRALIHTPGHDLESQELTEIEIGSWEPAPRADGIRGARNDGRGTPAAGLHHSGVSPGWVDSDRLDAAMTTFIAAAAGGAELGDELAAASLRRVRGRFSNVEVVEARRAGAAAHLRATSDGPDSELYADVTRHTNVYAFAEPLAVLIITQTWMNGEACRGGGRSGAQAWSGSQPLAAAIAAIIDELIES